MLQFWVRLLSAYDQLPLVFLVILLLAVRTLMGHVQLSPRATERGNQVGWALAILYIFYSFRVGNLEYPGEGLGAVLRACIGATLISSIAAVIGTAHEVLEQRAQAAARARSMAANKPVGPSQREIAERQRAADVQSRKRFELADRDDALGRVRRLSRFNERNR